MSDAKKNQTFRTRAVVGSLAMLGAGAAVIGGNAAFAADGIGTLELGPLPAASTAKEREADVERTQRGYNKALQEAKKHGVDSSRTLGNRLTIGSDIDDQATDLRQKVREVKRKKRQRAEARAEAAEEAKEAKEAKPEYGSTGSVGVDQGTLEAIAACESGGDPTAVSSDGTYRGKYQFDAGTWASMGGSGDPAAAPEAEQDYRAAMLYAQAGSSPWPICGG